MRYWPAGAFPPKQILVLWELLRFDVEHAVIDVMENGATDELHNLHLVPTDASTHTEKISNEDDTPAAPAAAGFNYCMTISMTHCKDDNDSFTENNAMEFELTEDGPELSNNESFTSCVDDTHNDTEKISMVPIKNDKHFVCLAAAIPDSVGSQGVGVPLEGSAVCVASWPQNPCGDEVGYELQHATSHDATGSHDNCPHDSLCDNNDDDDDTDNLPEPVMEFNFCMKRYKFKRRFAGPPPPTCMPCPQGASSSSSTPVPRSVLQGSEISLNPGSRSEDVELNCARIDELVQQKELALSESGRQLLPWQLAVDILKADYEDFETQSEAQELQPSTMAALRATVKQRIQHPENFKAANIEAVTDLIGMYASFEDTRSFIDSKLVGQCMHNMNVCLKCKDASGDGAPATPSIHNLHVHNSHTPALDDLLQFGEYERMDPYLSDSDSEQMSNRRIDDPLNPSVCPSKQGSCSVKAGLQMSMPCPVHTH